MDKTVKTPTISNSEFDRYGAGSIFLLGLLCLGGLTAGAINDYFLVQIILCMSLPMTTLVLFLSLQPIKWIYRIGTVSIIVNACLLIINQFL